MSPRSKIKLKFQCRHCGHNKKVSPIHNLAVHYPDLAKEWDFEKNYPIRPEDIAPKTNKIYFWLCSKGHSYSASPNNRVKPRKSRCNECYLSENNLALKNPELVKYVNTNAKVIIICKKHGEFIQNPSNHVSLGNGCPFCSGQGGFHVSETLAVNYPELAKEWDYDHEGNKGLTPNDVLVTDRTNTYWWRCNKGKPHSYRAKIKEKFPNIELLSKYIQSDMKIECKCNYCGQIWNPFPNNLLRTGCSKCKNQKMGDKK